MTRPRRRRSAAAAAQGAFGWPPDTDEISAEELRWTIFPRHEADFTGMVMREAQARGWMAYHTHDSRRSPAGFPDVVLAHAERGTAYIELKMPGKYPTKEQRAWLETLVAAGERVYLFYPKDWRTVISLLDGAIPNGYEHVVKARRMR
jgi:hypothetical protein